jgi:hypothetical protein
MATDLLKMFTQAQIDELTELLVARQKEKAVSGKRVDYDTMTPQELANVNKTIHPITHKLEHHEYPKALYAKRDGQLVTVTANDADHEAQLRAEHPLDWRYGMLELGYETCPSHGAGITVVDLAPVHGVALPEAMSPAAFAQGAIQAQEAAGKRGPGRPRKTA